jgi:hypothetical protein
VGEVEKPDLVCPSRALGDGPDGEARCHAPPTLMGSTLPSEAFAGPRSRYLVHGPRHVVWTTARCSADPPAGTAAPAASMGLDLPPGCDRTDSAGTSTRLQQPSWGLTPLQRSRRGRSTGPGIPTPSRSAFRVRTLLTVSSPPRSPVPGTGAAHGVHPAEPFPSAEPYAFRRPYPLAVPGIACSCSEDQEFTMPRSSRALLPTEVRTRLGPRPARADALMGIFASPERSPRTADPASRAHPSCASSTRSQETGRPALQGLGRHAGRQTPRGASRLS